MLESIAIAIFLNFVLNRESSFESDCVVIEMDRNSVILLLFASRSCVNDALGESCRVVKLLFSQQRHVNQNILCGVEHLEFREAIRHVVSFALLTLPRSMWVVFVLHVLPSRQSIANFVHHNLWC